MNESFELPTDNLYKFITLGAIAVFVLAAGFIFRDASRVNTAIYDADVELKAAGHDPKTGPPTDRELRKSYYRLKVAEHEGRSLMAFAKGWLGSAMGWALVAFAVGAGLWWFRVQRHQDAIVRLTAEKLKREGGTPQSVGVTA